MATVSKHRLSLPLLALAAVTAVASARGRRELAIARKEHLSATRRQSREGDHRQVADDGRGRTAPSPWEIPWHGWKDIFLRTYAEVNNDRLLAVAGGLVFLVLLAIFPAIGALVSLYALFADPSTISDHLAALATAMPADSFKLISDQVTRIASKSNGTLGLSSAFGLLFALWSANA